ncbi:MAG: protein kinase [Myxococcales bacterium]|nr:protein kinase [Myxococcales bacterium]
MFASLPWPATRRPSFAADGAPLTGLVLDGRYQLFEVAHRGDTTLTFRAQDRRLGRPCAVRLPIATDEDAALRLAREGQSLGVVEDAHVVRLLDQGRLPGDGRPYLVLEWLEGETLREHLDRHGPLAPARALAILRPVLQALRALHAQGVVHRDVRPAHVFLARDAAGVSSVRLIGLAGATRRPSLADERLGSFAYLAPERLDPAAGPVDARSDLYAVGVLLYELVAGRTPFAEVDPVRTEVARLDPAARLRWFHSHALPAHPDVELPAGLWDLCLTLLERRPDDRARSADGVLRRLDALQGDAAVERRGVVPSSSAPTDSLPALGLRLPPAAALSVALAGFEEPPSLEGEATVAEPSPDELAEVLGAEAADEDDIPTRAIGPRPVTGAPVGVRRPTLASRPAARVSPFVEASLPRRRCRPLAPRALAPRASVPGTTWQAQPTPPARVPSAPWRPSIPLPPRAVADVRTPRVAVIPGQRPSRLPLVALSLVTAALAALALLTLRTPEAPARRADAPVQLSIGTDAP